MKKTNLNFGDDVFIIYGSKNDKSIMFLLEALKGDYEPHMMSCLRKIVTPGSFCLDIGSNIGVITFPLSKLAGNNGHVYSIEACRTNYEYLKMNISANEVNNVSSYCLALFDKSGEIEFCYVDEFAGGSFTSITGASDPRAVRERVRCVTLDEFVVENKIEKIDFIKIDVEGAEIHVLSGAEETLKKFNPKLLIELNPHCLELHFAKTGKDLFDALCSLFSQIYVVDKRDINGSLIKVKTYADLLRHQKPNDTFQDLLCTNE